MSHSYDVVVCSRSFSFNPVLREELLSKFSKVKFNEDGKTLSGHELINFLQGSERAIIGLENIDSGILNELPYLKIISKYGVGLNNLDLQAMYNKKIKLGWKPGVNKRSVSELTLSLMLNLLHHISYSHKQFHNNGGVWKQYVGSDLTGKTVGIIGCGRIGMDLVKLLQPFDCSILVNDIRPIERPEFAKYFKQVSIIELLMQSDVVTVHTPLNESTKNLINYEEMSKMKRDAILINAARGGIVNEEALLCALKEKIIASAALDVFTSEPPSPDYELLNHPNLVFTTHIGGSSKEAILAMGRAAIEGLFHANEVDLELLK